MVFKAAMMRRIMFTIRKTISHTWAVIAVFLVWEIFVRVQGFNQIVLPSPAIVFASLVQDSDLYVAATLKTLWVALAGLLIGATIGGIAAIIGWLSAFASGFVSASAIVVRSVPFVVFVPVLATIMGYTNNMVITIVALMSFFPSFVLVSSGLTSLPSAASDVSRVYGATPLRKLIYLALPAAASNWLASIRLSSSRAILAGMVAEFLTGIDGLGKLFLMARADLKSEQALGAAVIAAIASLLLFYLAGLAEKMVNRRLS
jgi:NitT/TauT family transport system permease protein